MSIRERARRALLGASRDPLDPAVFHQLSLVAFLAWVGLGADGLSSSCYGPEEAFRALSGHTHLAVFLAVAISVTILVISASYSQIIELFPSGGGGYLVATKLLGAGSGLVSGAALVIDYALTIAMSVSVGVAALCSLRAQPVPQESQLALALLVVGGLIVLNLRGVRESVTLLLPIFVLFLLTHVLLIGVGIGRHLDAMPTLVAETVRDTRETWALLGPIGTLALLLRAFSLGGGTFTGIEAVSNGLQILREPKVRTGRRTMVYMAVSLSLVAGGLLLCYLLANVSRVEGETLNATLVKLVAHEVLGSGRTATSVVFLTLLSEGALLFVAAQAGFLDGPRVLASMAVDSWVPHRFSLLSDRLVTQNGILVMGLGAASLLVYTKGAADLIVVMYSINVFLTFTLSQLGMCVHWWRARREEPSWAHRLLVNGVGLLATGSILLVTVSLKLREGGWVTVVITGAAVALCVGVRRHYRSIGLFVARADDVLVQVAARTSESGAVPKVLEGGVSRGTPTAVFLVSGFNGLGIHSVLQVQKMFPRHFRNAVFLSVGVVDSASFKGATEVENLRRETERDLTKYVQFARGLGMHAEHHLSVGTDLLDELTELCLEVGKSYDRAVFFTAKLIFPQENLLNRFLHNQTPFALQRRLQMDGLQAVILPIQVKV